MLASRRSLVVLIPTLCATLALVACGRHFGGADVKGSGNPASAARAVGPFTGVEATGAFRLEVRSGAAAPTVVVEGDDNIVPLFVTEASEGKLRLRLPSGSYAPSVPLVVRVAAPGITALSAFGAIDARVEGISGAEFELALTGACKTQVSGVVQAAALTLNGASLVEAFGLDAGSVKLEQTGSSTALVQARDRLAVHSSGASRVTYRGTPQVESTVSGSSTVRPE